LRLSRLFRYVKSIFCNIFFFCCGILRTSSEPFASRSIFQQVGTSSDASSISNSTQDVIFGIRWQKWSVCVYIRRNLIFYERSYPLPFSLAWVGSTESPWSIYIDCGFEHRGGRLKHEMNVNAHWNKIRFHGTEFVIHRISQFS
jgi:hypothetical protein